MSTRFFIVSRAEAGRPLSRCLTARLSLSFGAVRRLLREGRVRVNGAPCADIDHRLQRGQRVQVRLIASPHKVKKSAPRPPVESRPSRGPRPIVRHVDAHVVVVEKPAGLTTMRHAEDVAEFSGRARRFLPPTLADLLPDVLAKRAGGAKATVLAVHRLDKDTSGLVVFARTVEAERHLNRQFRGHTIERHYVALVRGRPREGRIESWLVPDRGDGRRGSSADSGEGKRAVTHFRVLEAFGEYTLVECRLETGRTHQVRIHLGEAGTPLCGERIYDRPLNGQPAADDSGMKRIALHAALLGFEHPATGERMRWSSPPPKDMANLVRRLQNRTRRNAD